MKEWSSDIKEIIHKELKDVKESDLRFFRIEEFIRNIERTEQFSEQCPHCRLNKIEIKMHINKIGEAVKVPGKSRREYDRLISRLSKHMNKEHNFYPPFHYTYTYSFIGIVAGIAIGIIANLIFPQSNWLILIISLTTGIITGNIYGHKKDRVIRNENRLM